MVKIVLAIALMAIPHTSTLQDDEAKSGSSKGKSKKTPLSEVYPLDTCAVAGKKLGSMGDPIVHIHEGRQVKFCCKGCLPSFNKNPAKYLAKVDEKIVKMQKPNYPANNCIFSDEPLGPKSKDVVVNNRLVRVCCGGCARKLMKDPAPTFRKLDEQIKAKQSKTYPLKTCVVSNEPLDSMGKPVDVIVSNTLVKVCCKGCVRKLSSNPTPVLTRLKAAQKGE